MVPSEVLLNEIKQYQMQKYLEDVPLTPLLYVSQVASNLAFAGNVGGFIFSNPYQGTS